MLLCPYMVIITPAMVVINVFIVLALGMLMIEAD